MAFISGLINQNTKVTGRTISSTDGASMFGVMVESITENGAKISCRALGISTTKMADSTLVNSKMTINMDTALTRGLMGRYTKVIGKMGNSAVKGSILPMMV